MKYYRTYIFKFKMSNGVYAYAGSRMSQFINPYDDTYSGSGLVISNAVKKYGQQCIIDRVWYDHSSAEAMKMHEKQLIRRLKSMLGDRCVNIAAGGDGNIFMYMSPAMIKAIREKCSATMVKKWTTAEFRYNRRHWTQTEAGKFHASNKFKDLWKTEEYSKAVKAGLAKAMQTSEYKDKCSKRSREMWQRPGYRESHSGFKSKRRGEHWNLEPQLYKLWLESNKPKHARFRTIAVSSSMPDVNYSRMVDYFNRITNETE